MSSSRTVPGRPGAGRRALLGALAFAAALLAPASPASAETLMGFTEAPVQNELPAASQNRLLDLERAAGGQLHRVVIMWSDVEPTLRNGTPVQNWDYYDRVINASLARGLRPVLTLMSAPTWAQKPFECQGANCPPSPTRLAEWSRFAYDVTKRYPGAAAIEVWNEPNGRGQWQTSAGPDPERYAQLFSHAAGAIHYADPTMPVLIGGITYWERDEPRLRMTIPTFLERFYRAGGGYQLQPGDGLGLHAYPWVDELETLDTLFAKIVRQARNALAAYDPNRKIWITETGVTTTGRWAVGERAQAKGILTLWRKVPQMDDVRAMLIHSTVEAPYDPNHTHEQGYGLVKRSTLQPKTAYCALAEQAGASRAFTGCPAGVLADLGEAGTATSSSGDPVSDVGDSAGDGATADGLSALRERARASCRRRLRARDSWSDATRAERRLMVRRCVRRYVRRRAA